MISKLQGDGKVNKTGIYTYDKVMIPLRLPPETYEKLVLYVQHKKKEQRGYSINQCLTELIEGKIGKQSDK